MAANKVLCLDKGATICIVVAHREHPTSRSTGQPPFGTAAGELVVSVLWQSPLGIELKLLKGIESYNARKIIGSTVY